MIPRQDIPSPHRRGFSLLELVVVIVIVAVATAMAMPRYLASLSRYRAALAAQRVATDLGYAQETARRMSKSVTVVIDTTADTLRLVDVPDIDHPWTEESGEDPQGGLLDWLIGQIGGGGGGEDPPPMNEYVTRFGGDPYHADILSASFGGGNTVVYDGYGIPDESGTVVVQVGDVRKTVVLSSYTQKATVE